MRALIDRPYPVHGGDQRFDLFCPDSDGPLPLLVFLHGGGWVSGSKEDYRDEALWAARQGFACACVGYRLAPLYPFPTPVADVQRFFRYVQGEAGALGVDPSKVLAVGNSAGGHLALMAGLCPELLDGDGGPAARATATVAICPITDLRDPFETHLPVGHAFLEQFLGVPLAEAGESLGAASPAAYASHAVGPVTLLHGTEDDIVPFDQSVRLAREFERLGRPHHFVALEGEAHSFTLPAWEVVRGGYIDQAERLREAAL